MLAPLALLPDEILLKIFELLPTIPLKELRFSRRLQAAATDALFSNFVLGFPGEDPHHQQRLLNNLLTTPSLGRMVKTVIFHYNWTEETYHELRDGIPKYIIMHVLHAIEKLPNVETVRFEGNWRPADLDWPLREAKLGKIQHIFIDGQTFDLNFTANESFVAIVATNEVRTEHETFFPKLQRRTINPFSREALHRRLTCMIHNPPIDFYRSMNLRHLTIHGLCPYITNLTSFFDQPTFKQLSLINATVTAESSHEPGYFAVRCPLHRLFLDILYEEYSTKSPRPIADVPRVDLVNVSKLGWTGSVSVSNAEIQEWLRMREVDPWEEDTKKKSDPWITDKLAGFSLPADLFRVKAISDKAELAAAAKGEKVVGLLQLNSPDYWEARDCGIWPLRSLNVDWKRPGAQVQGIFPHITTKWILITAARADPTGADNDNDDGDNGDFGDDPPSDLDNDIDNGPSEPEDTGFHDSDEYWSD